MNEVADERQVPVLLTPAELDLLRVAVRYLLRSEDDPATIEELKALLGRLAGPPEPG